MLNINKMSKEINHPEWEKENSLTAPEDRTSTRENPWRPDQGAPVLTNVEVDEAIGVLNNTKFMGKFPRVDRSYADPPPPNQNIGLVSFTPAKGATPNESGVYGYAKLRGNFATDIEANQRAEYLIRNVDSYHQIYHTYVGRPFPMTASSDYSAEVEEIDIRKQMSESISSEIKAKKQQEKRAMDDIKEKEEELLTESRKAVRGEEVYDPYDNYITLKVKKAQLSWTYLEHQKKMEEVKGILIKTRKDLEELDEEHPEFKDKYFDKYMEARKNAGLEGKYAESKETSEANFIQYMVEDAVIPEVDALYEETYGSKGAEEEKSA